MPLPSAYVTVKLLRIATLPSGFLSGTNQPYAVARIGNARAGYAHFGRSRPIASGAASIDFTAEPTTWQHSVPVRTGEDVEAVVEIWDDRGDAAPPSTPLHRFTEQISPPWQPQTIAPSGTPALYLEVDSEYSRTYVQALVARSRSSSGASGALRLKKELFVELTEIRGLYEPGHTPGPGPHKLAEYHQGYLSHDHRGRIYINHDLNGDWAKDQQLIQVTAKVMPRGLALPSDAKIRWTVLDPDDPFNDRRDCHQKWGPYIDRNDYDSSGDPTGAEGDDNPLARQNAAASGSPAALFDQSPRWEQAGGHALTVVSDTEALTEVDGATKESKVKIHCPNVGGTNLIVRAEVDTSTSATIFPAQTGIMTMWKRLDVELLRMRGAHSLQAAVQGVAQYLEPACVQLDFTPERLLDAAHTKAHMGTNIGNSSSRAQAWLARSGVFDHRGDKGWFCLAAAQHSMPPPTKSTVYDSSASGAGGWSIVRTGSSEVVVIDERLSLSPPGVAEFEWTETVSGTPQSRSASFIFSRALVDRPSAGQTTLRIWGNDIQHKFTGHDSDGSLDHAYKHRLKFYPRGQVEEPGGTWSAGSNGFGIPGSATLKVKTGVAIAGTSPSVTAGGTSYFAGRTVLYTHHNKYSDTDSAGNVVPKPDFNDTVLKTVVHEFVHAFGMPHKCGFWDYRTPRHKSCSMNYFNTLLIDPATEELQWGTEGRTGPHLCGRHLMEVRRVHLEDNNGLSW